MAMTDEQRLVVSLEARMNKYEKDMARASRATNDNFRSMENRSKRFSNNLEKTMAGTSARVGGILKNFGAGLLAGVAAGGIGGVVMKIGDIAKGIATIGDRAKQAGLDAQDFQRIAFVAEQNRIEVDDLTSGIREMQLRMNEFITSAGKSGTAAETLRRLGYGVDEIQRKLRRPLDLFTEIVGKVERLDRASQIRIFDDIFGGDGERLVRIISEGERGIRAQIQAAEDLGIVLSDEVIAKAEEIDRQFNIITTTVGTGLKGAIVEAASALAGFIDSFRAFEDQHSRTLDARLAEIGKQRLDAENQILRLREQQAEAIPGNPFGHDYASDIADVKARNAALAEEERRILGVLAARERPAQLPAVEVTAPAPAAPASKPAATSAAGRSRTSTVERERQAVRDLIAEYEQEIRMLGMTDRERRAAEASRRAGAAATDDQRRQIIALNEQLYQETRAQEQATAKAEQAAQAQREFVGGLASDLLHGVAPAEALSRALSRLADTILNELVDAIFSAKGAGSGSGGLFGSMGGLFGGLLKGIAGIFGFSEGGWTGPGSKYQPAGIVHAGEFVMSKQATDRLGVENLEALHRGALKGFAEGGFVGSAPAVHRTHMPTNGNMVQPIQINAPITVNGSAGTPEQNDDLAKRMSKQLEGTMRGVVVDELRRQSRPGNTISRMTR